MNDKLAIRNTSFDVLKFFAIFLVVWGHCIQNLHSCNYCEEPVYRIIYSFHMPLFMTISGFFSLSSMTAPPDFFLKKKFRQLLLPSFTWGGVRFVLIIGFAIISDGVINRSRIISSFLGLMFGMGAYWFLKACFLCYVFAYIALRFPNRGIGIVFTLILSQFTPWYNMWLMYPCFLIGIALKSKQRLLNVLHFYGSYLLLFLCLLFFWNESYLKYSKGLGLGLLNYIYGTEEILIVLHYGLYKFLVGILGSLGIIGLFSRFIPQNSDNICIRLCADWGKYTLGIYLMDSLFTGAILPLLLNLDGMNFFLFNFVITPSISVLFIAVGVFIIKKTSKNKFCGLLFWGKDYSKK